MNLVVARWLCCLFMYAALFAPQLLRATNKMWLKRGHTTDFTLVDTRTIIILCSAVDDVMNVTKVTLSPDPPKRSENLTVTVYGTLSESLNEGAYLMTKVRKGSIHFPRIRFPACDYILGGCPVSQSSDRIDLQFNLPRLIPGGTYEVEIILYNVEANPTVKRLFARWFSLSPWSKHLMDSNSGSPSSSSENFEEGKRAACIRGSIEIV